MMKVKCPKCGGKTKEVQPGSWWQCQNKACLALLYQVKRDANAHNL